MQHVSAKDYGLFLADDDPKKGVWMENGRTLEYYLVRNGVSISARWFSTFKPPVITLRLQDLLEYKKKKRSLRVRMLDGTVKLLMVDDSQPVAQVGHSDSKIGPLSHFF